MWCCVGHSLTTPRTVSRLNLDCGFTSRRRPACTQTCHSLGPPSACLNVSCGFTSLHECILAVERQHECTPACQRGFLCVHLTLNLSESVVAVLQDVCLKASSMPEWVAGLYSSLLAGPISLLTHACGKSLGAFLPGSPTRLLCAQPACGTHPAPNACLLTGALQARHVPLRVRRDG